MNPGLEGLSSVRKDVSELLEQKVVPALGAHQQGVLCRLGMLAREEGPAHGAWRQRRRPEVK